MISHLKIFTNKQMTNKTLVARHSSGNIQLVLRYHPCENTLMKTLQA